MVLVGSTNGGKDAGNDEAVVDYKGNPVDKSRTGRWLGAGLILGTELSERICVMGISMNLVTYLIGTLHLSSTKSANIVTNFMGTLNLLGLLGGFVADAKLGRYRTVAVSGSIAALDEERPSLTRMTYHIQQYQKMILPLHAKTGVTLLTLATTLPSMTPPPCDSRKNETCIEATGSQLALLYAALYTIALGGGGIKSNVSGFGSDQFDINDPKEEKAMIYFFNRFYFCISTGSLFAVTVLVYIQDNVGRGWGYGISAVTMILAVSILFCGTRVYRYKKPQGSPLTIIWRVVFLAWKKRKLPHPSDPSFLNDYHNAKVTYTPKFRCLEKAAILDDYAAANENRNNPWIVSTVTQVEEVKMVIKLIPVWSTSILFWTIYSQMNTFTIEQATFMDRRLGSFTVPAGSFSLFLFITILLFTSLNEKLFIPLARRMTHSREGIRSLQRIGIGLVFSVFAMVAAALVEMQRREKDVREGRQLSAFWLVPQFFLVGAGEAFAYVGQLEFFIREAPEKMKSMSTGLFLSSLSMGYFVSSLLVSIVDATTNRKWLRSNLNEARLDNFYWMLAILMVLNFLVFVAFATKHQYKVQNFIMGDEEELKSWKNGNIKDAGKNGNDMEEEP